MNPIGDRGKECVGDLRQKSAEESGWIACHRIKGQTTEVISKIMLGENVRLSIVRQAVYVLKAEKSGNRD